MKRRSGGRSARAAKQVISSETVATSSEVSGHASVDCVELLRAQGESPSTALTLTDIFSKFQSHRGDLDQDWIMLQEDGGGGTTLPMAEEVVAKLRHYQERLQTIRHQRFVAASRAANAEQSVLLKGKEQTMTSMEGLQGAPRTASPRAPRKVSPQDVSGGADDDAEYEPRDPSVAESRSPSRTRAHGGDSRSSSHKGEGVTREEVDEEMAEDGIRGDYLTLRPTAGHLSGGLTANDLQATVTIGGGEASTDASAPSDFTLRAINNPRGVEMPDPSSSKRLQYVVPLWSVERFRRYGGYCASSALVALHQEVMDFLDYIRPTQGEVTVRRLLEREVSAIALRLWPECEPIVYGSMTTQLLLPLSDVDITLLNVPVSTEEALTALASAISQAGLCNSAYPQAILKTKVPLVKFAHRGSLIDVDISVNATDGKTNTAVVQQELDRFPEARPLIVLIKYFLRQREMHEPYHGGLGSFATTLLVLSFLQHHPIYTNRTAERAFTGLGKLLVDFFRYAGQYWNYNRCGVSLTEGGYYFRRTDGGGMSPVSPRSFNSPMGPPQVLIEDPGNAANNVASSLRNYHMISSVFTYAYNVLTANFVRPEQIDGDGEAAGVSPDAADIACRPTLLSRVLHVDADTVAQRQSVAAAYESLCRERPEYMKELQRYRYDEDKSMLDGTRPGRVGMTVSGLASTVPVERRTLTAMAAEAQQRALDRGSAPKRKGRDDDSSSNSGSHTEGSGSNASSVRMQLRSGLRRRHRYDS